jgi:hypothetical protein
MILSIQEQDWPAVVLRVSSAIDLEASVRESGVLKRKRQVRSGSDLLRLALAYGPGGQSLRETAAWAELQGVASLSDVALMYRLRDAADWLGQIAGGLLRAAAAQDGQAAPPFRLKVIDGSVISSPGKGPRWRLHGIYDVAQARFSHMDLTSGRTAEALERAPTGPGELVLADRVYGRPGGLRHLIEAGTQFLVRVGRRSLRLQHPDGTPFDLAAALDISQARGEHDLPVLVLDGADPHARPMSARLVILKKPPEAAQKARQRALRESQRGGHRSDPLSLRSAEHLMMITSLAPNQADPQALGRLYRLRWRIELAFKRLKSLIHIDRLPAKTPDLARAWIFAHLIAALLVEDFSPRLRDSPP